MQSPPRCASRRVALEHVHTHARAHTRATTETEARISQRTVARIHSKRAAYSHPHSQRTGRAFTVRLARIHCGRGAHALHQHAGLTSAHAQDSHTHASDGLPSAPYSRCPTSLHSQHLFLIHSCSARPSDTALFVFLPLFHCPLDSPLFGYRPPPQPTPSRVLGSLARSGSIHPHPNLIHSCCAR